MVITHLYVDQAESAPAFDGQFRFPSSAGAIRSLWVTQQGK